MLMRGGTSKGLYFLAEDLPVSVEERDDLLLRTMGSPDARQIDGVGGAHPLTSKVAIVSKSTSPEADVDFLFAQVSVTEALVDTKPNCGNILAGVGPFAIERGLVAPQSPVTRGVSYLAGAEWRVINTRSLIPRKCHDSIGVFAAVSVATACVLPGTIAYPMASVPPGMVKVMKMEQSLR